MTTVNNDDTIARAGLADPEHHGVHTDIPKHEARGSMDVRKTSLAHHDVELDDEEYEDRPTDEEMRTLRRVSGKIMWSMWTIAFVELCERFSYYGSSVLYTNFVNQPLPPGSTTGAPLNPGDENAQAGALGMGTQAAQGLSLFNQFFAYIMPLVG